MENRNYKERSKYKQNKKNGNDWCAEKVFG